MRRSIVLATALAIVIGAAAPAAAQEDPVAASPDGTKTAATVDLKWKRVKLPKAGDFIWVHDIIPASSGFLAVGGGVRKSPRALARVWRSNNGRRWESVPLSGLARNGLPRAITQTPSGGFVMVGQGSCAIPCAVAWRSPDGVAWERLSETIPESVMYDVVAFDGRLIAVGCHTPGFHCLAGRVWASDDDGASWQASGDVPGIMFHAVTAVDGQLVAGGDTDGFDTARGTAATSPDGVTWAIQEPGGKLGWMRAAGDRGYRALVGGGDHKPSGQKTAAKLMVSSDDGGFEVVRSDRFRKGFFIDVASHGDIVLLSGIYGAKRVTMPWSVWTSDMTTFKRVRFPKADEQRYGEAMAVALSRNGVRAVVGGRSGDKGAMWFSRVR